MEEVVTAPPSDRPDDQRPPGAASYDRILPVATPAQVRAYARRLTLAYPRRLALALGLHGLSAVAGLAAPRLLGELVEDVRHGTSSWSADRTAIAIAAFVVVQGVLLRFAVYASARLGEQVLARLREEFVDRVLELPLSTVERAGTGDLITRTSRDVDILSRSVRHAVPETLIAIVTGAFALGALVLVGPLTALPCLVGVPVLWSGTRWYLARAREGYLWENAAWGSVTAGLTETVEGARTVEALRLERRRIERADRDIAGTWAAERYTLGLRTVWFPMIEIGYVLPVVATLLAGGLLYTWGLASLAQVTAATLYVQQLIDPLDRLLSWIDELQVGGASLARLLGVSEARADRPAAAGRRPSDGRISVSGVRYAYRAGHDVLHGVDLRLRPGERLAMVGPSGAGKSTLGRLVAGILRPRTGTVAVGGVPLADLPLEELRGHVALVTQEHHVFKGTVRDNLVMARPGASAAEVDTALAAVEADWVAELPDGLDTRVGTGGLALSPARAQQLALARLVLADPHTLVLDEATSLLDPRAARHLERTLSAVLAGRTVVAIAHRLHTAHDADRVAVVEDGRIAELGSHDELIAANGSYAALWRSWHGGPSERNPVSREA
jgi:ABC-type multidrug transport system fused ATPase/permease subunit